MADDQHVNILKQGADSWNEWREREFYVAPDLSRQDLRGVEIAKMDLRGANLSGVNLSGEYLSNTHLSDTNLTEANLSGANLSKADLRGANCFRAELIGANLHGAYLQAVDFRDADLSDANLCGTYLGGTNFTGAWFFNTDFSESTLNATIFGSNDLSNAKGLEQVQHGGPSVFGIDTFYRSKGNIPENLLRDAGVPDDFITFFPSLTARPIEFYKCFISFTEIDDEFAEKLYTDLTAAGIKCWRWKEDAKWGKTLNRSIDEAVRLYDKVIVVCSAESLNSPIVLREIKRALQKEDMLARQGKDNEVLFPIRLDNYILDAWDHYLKPDVIDKYLGDFRQWKEPGEYEKSLSRLMRDLKL